MLEVEKRFNKVCMEYDDPGENDYKGSILLKTFENQKFGEDLLAFYITVKQKFDCINAFIVTATRIIEINAYTTMCITNSRKYKSLQKINIEQAFDDRQIEKVLHDEIKPERIQIRLAFICDNNETEEFVWENEEDEESIFGALNFSKQLLKIQAGI
jgi:hypothetical protein